jgi:hypothetical protein
MHPHVTPNAQRNERALVTVAGPMMNQEPQACTAGPAAEAIAPDHALAQATEKAQGMLPPVIARTATAEALQLDGLPASAQQS